MGMFAVSMFKVGLILIEVGAPALSFAWLIGQGVPPLVPELQVLEYLPAVPVVLAGLLWQCRARKRLSRLAMALATLLAFTHVYFRDVAPHKRVPYQGQEAGIRIVHWNVGQMLPGEVEIVAQLRQVKADIVALSEVPTGRTFPQLYTLLGTESEVIHVHNLMLISSYPIALEDKKKLWDGRTASFIVKTPEHPLRIVLTDVDSNPMKSRIDVIAQILEQVAPLDEGIPEIVMGDFNTPRYAKAFAPFRTRYDHAYERSGQGYPYSWPAPLPLLHIDHMWLEHRIQSFSYTLRQGIVSDHTMQVLDLAQPFLKENQD